MSDRRKKLEGNGLYESSRMMLPEHKEAYIAHQEQLRRQPRPELDEQERERLGQLLAASLMDGRQLVVTLFGEVEAVQLTGRVVRLDELTQRLLLQLQQQGEERRWVGLHEIVAVCEG